MAEVFLHKRPKKSKGFALQDSRGLIPTSGDIGIEIEVEGKNLPGVSFNNSVLPSMWAYHHDGSLRGEENGEYVLKSPILFDEVKDALVKLWECFEDCKTKIDDSHRTSVHVHLNVQKFHTNRLVSLMALYIVFEEILTAWCGEYRVGNLFCLRAKDAPGIIQRIIEYARKDFKGQVADGLHYSGMNLNALSKYGSLEFRTLRGTQDVDTILKWCTILRRLYDLSGEFKDPREIMYLFSAEGPVSFYQTILGDCWGWITGEIPFAEKEIRDSMYEGVRLAQDICYCRNWSEFEEVVLSKDPFGRSSASVAQQMDEIAEIIQINQQTLEQWNEVFPELPSPLGGPSLMPVHGGINTFEYPQGPEEIEDDEPFNFED